MTGRVIERSRITWTYDPDDDDRRDLAELGMRRGDPAYRVILQGEDEWSGWVLWLWGVASDEPRRHRYAGFYRLVIRQPPTEVWVWLLVAEARRCRGIYGDSDYAEKPATIRVEWGDRGRLPGMISLTGLEFKPGAGPDLLPLRIPLLMLQAQAQVGRRAGSGAAFTNEDEYRAAIRRDVIERADEQKWHLQSAEGWQIARWLGIAERTMFKYNARWRISLDDIRHRRI